MTAEMIAELAAARLDKAANPPVKDLNPAAAETMMRTAVVDAYLYRGQRAGAETVTFVCAALVKELREDIQGLGVGWLPVAEVRLAIRIAALAELEFYPSVSAFYRAVAAYVRSEGAQVFAKAQQMARDKRRKEAGALPAPDLDKTAAALAEEFAKK